MDRDESHVVAAAFEPVYGSERRIRGRVGSQLRIAMVQYTLPRENCPMDVPEPCGCVAPCLIKVAGGLVDVEDTDPVRIVTWAEGLATTTMHNDPIAALEPAIDDRRLRPFCL